MTKAKIVCLCGPVKFEDHFKLANLREGLSGNVVVMPLLGLKGDHTEVVEALRHLHRQKIEMADEILVLNVDGYLGADTKEEVEYARSLGKKIRWYAEEMGGR